MNMDEQTVKQITQNQTRSKLFIRIATICLVVAAAVCIVMQVTKMQESNPTLYYIMWGVVAIFAVSGMILLGCGDRFNFKNSRIAQQLAAKFFVEQFKDINFFTGSIAHIQFCYRADEMDDEELENLPDEMESAVVIKYEQTNLRFEFDLRPVWDIPCALSYGRGKTITENDMIFDYLQAKCYLSANSGKMPVEVTFDDGLGKKPKYIVANGQLLEFKTEKNIFIKYKLL